jgi:hypothetical protein
MTERRDKEIKMRYFHTLVDSTVKRLISRHITWGELTGRYKQPDWCGYPNALEGVMGCWSLTDLFDIISREYCAGCDCFIKDDKTEGNV